MCRVGNGLGAVKGCNRFRQDGVEQIRSAQAADPHAFRAIEIRAHQIRAAQLRAQQVRVAHVRLHQARATQIGHRQIGAGQIRAMQMRALQIDAGEIGLGQIHAGQIGFCARLTAGFDPLPVLIEHFGELDHRNARERFFRASFRKDQPVFQLLIGNRRGFVGGVRDRRLFCFRGYFCSDFGHRLGAGHNFQLSLRFQSHSYCSCFDFAHSYPSRAGWQGAVRHGILAAAGSIGFPLSFFSALQASGLADRAFPRPPENDHPKIIKRNPVARSTTARNITDGIGYCHTHSSPPK